MYRPPKALSKRKSLPTKPFGASSPEEAEKAALSGKELSGPQRPKLPRMKSMYKGKGGY